MDQSKVLNHFVEIIPELFYYVVSEFTVYATLAPNTKCLNAIVHFKKI